MLPHRRHGRAEDHTSEVHQRAEQLGRASVFQARQRLGATSQALFLRVRLRAWEDRVSLRVNSHITYLLDASRYLSSVENVLASTTASDARAAVAYADGAEAAHEVGHLEAEVGAEAAHEVSHVEAEEIEQVHNVHVRLLLRGAELEQEVRVRVPCA